VSGTAADLLVVGAPVWTGDPGRPWADALAVRAGRLAAVGAEREVLALRGPATRVLRLDAGLVLPGFQDAHVHPLEGGLEQLGCALHEVEPAGYGAAVAAWAAAHPDAPWVVGGGWSMDAFPGGSPGRAALDAVVPDRPAYLTSRDGHSAWVNGAALALAGVGAASPDPPRGRVERDPGGAPSGTLHEAAMDLVRALLPEPTPAQLEDALRHAQAHLHRLGITAWQEAWVTAPMLAAYRSLADRGELTGRAVAALKWRPELGLEQLEELRELRRQAEVGRLRATSVKLFQDGVFESFTAAMLDPYLDGSGAPGGDRGASMYPPEELTRIVVALDRDGFDAHVHAIGDRAVREALDAVEAAAAENGRRDARHQIAHLQFVHPADRNRFRRLRVVANAQPFWACLDGYMRDLTLPFVEPERAAWQYPWASLRRAGAVLAFGSDWTVSTADPLLELEVAVNRVAPDDRGAEPFLPAERLDLPAALAAFTAGSAYANRLEATTGTLAPGKLADLAVLDRDPFDQGAGPVGDARVLATLVEGEPVHADPGLDLD
jgi:predicted amidohydrolase YtcJ